MSEVTMTIDGAMKLPKGMAVCRVIVPWGALKRCQRAAVSAAPVARRQVSGKCCPPKKAA